MNKSPTSSTTKNNRNSAPADPFFGLENNGSTKSENLKMSRVSDPSATQELNQRNSNSSSS